VSKEAVELKTMKCPVQEGITVTVILYKDGSTDYECSANNYACSGPGYHNSCPKNSS